QMKSKIMSNEMFQSICDMMLRTPQRTMIGGIEANLDPAVWTNDPIQVPFQLLLAKQPSWTPEYKSYVLSLAPHADYREYEGVGHFLHMEKPGMINAAITEFLKQNRLLQ
ncbi:MAG: alpha/beta fold hydrolase, partial [Planctomycetota bacterium]